ncbi:hypothetical protein MD588_06690 [Photobacterium sp. SDRW27]|uniref:hypothetical protein n=1 Tax=Photobacterium obscurum TaxID=2829490 RepID=UPI0022444344|nr:hypothetical protein [Photobacterium obscurum]MCW8328492.1 hypothetical protein [Photobacterium obscurum]
MDQANELREYFIEEKRVQVLDILKKLRNSILRGERHEVSVLLIELNQAYMAFEAIYLP